MLDRIFLCIISLCMGLLLTEPNSHYVVLNVPPERVRNVHAPLHQQLLQVYAKCNAMLREREEGVQDAQRTILTYSPLQKHHHHLSPEFFGLSSTQTHGSIPIQLGNSGWYAQDWGRSGCVRRCRCMCDCPL